MAIYILGLNAYHADSSAALLEDGVLVAAAEEERYRRIKHWGGFPSQAIAYCLREAGIRLEDVSHIALNSDPRARLWRKTAYVLSRGPSFAFITQRLANARRRAGAAEALCSAFPDQTFHGTLHRIEHHRCHLASAFFASPFERAAVLSVDGFGDFASAAWGLGTGARLRCDGGVFFPHSLGIFYEAITQFLGFPSYGDEYKVMGLAPYGEPRYLAQMRQLVRVQKDGRYRLDLRYFLHQRRRVTHRFDAGAPEIGTLHAPALAKLLGPARHPDEPLTDRHRDLAASAQRMYEEAFFALLRSLHARYREDRLALAGGCAMNSVANGRIPLHTPFREVYVQAAPGDAGGALGAALACAQEVGLPRPPPLRHAYWGDSFTANDIQALIDTQADALRAARCTVRRMDEAALCEAAASAIAAARVVGWFQGRMEWGPRALGARSILADPRRADMKDILNLKIKRRESFRPFAPAILREQVGEWFEQDGDVPFMSQVFPVRAGKRAQIPAVTHVDGSGRLQTVERTQNPRYYRLIETFARRTGVPILLNTSFNENEPIVCTPAQALGCFLRTRMDVLVLGDMLLERSS